MDYLQLSERVKLVQSKLDIYEIVSRHVTLKKDGEFYVGRCPFHEDESESLTVNAGEGKFYCYKCHAGGNALNFIARMQNISLKEAAELQAKDLKFELYSTKINFDDERITRQNRELTEINNYAQNFYHEILTTAEEGDVCRKYLESRGITKKEIEKFQLGFAPNHDRALTTFLDEYDFKLYEMIQSGLVEGTDEGFTDKFRDCITIPIQNQFGITALIGRVLNFEKKIFYESEGVSSKYVYTKENPIFNRRQIIFGFQSARSAIVKSHRVIIVEDCLDAVFLNSIGVENVVTVFDKTLTYEQAEILSPITKRIIFCLKHGDELKIEEETLMSISQHGGKVFVAALSESPYEFVSANGVENFYKNLEGSVPFDDYEHSKKICAEDTATIKKPNTQNILTPNKLPIDNQTIEKSGDIILKLACREPGLFKYIMAILPKEIFSKPHQELIEYLSICLEENSRPSKEGAAIFFDGKVDEKILDMIEDTKNITSTEQQAFEDGMDFLLRKVWNSTYAQIKNAAMSEKKSQDKNLKKLSDMQKKL